MWNLFSRYLVTGAVRLASFSCSSTFTRWQTKRYPRTNRLMTHQNLIRADICMSLGGEAVWI